MLSILFLPKDYVENYYVADIIVIEKGKLENHQILEHDKLIRKQKDSDYLYKDLTTGYYHQGFLDLKKARLGTGSNVCFKIKNSLVTYYPFLAFKKITEQEALELYQKLPEIKKLIDKKVDISELIKESRTGYSTSNNKKHKIKKLKF
jgi:hypothetical protein